MFPDWPLCCRYWPAAFGLEFETQTDRVSVAQASGRRGNMAPAAAVAPMTPTLRRRRLDGIRFPPMAAKLYRPASTSVVADMKAVARDPAPTRITTVSPSCGAVNGDSVKLSAFSYGDAWECCENPTENAGIRLVGEPVLLAGRRFPCVKQTR